ncbi:hypothetical protein MIT9_P0802 [Methylomarinovum caldicuralii]|uniref:Uncharacterized protein n=1 Tax=Methylomarinovum caldicuralii TaxID=438856 RepID=A0AAU9C5N6_9GAMM|nr:hypothetical protein [Methylomarinovum caldicuralii]BCX81224.1 hypothetical protein MIT9_P0802 [Methylomarinovum caldicuralii]
MAHVHGDKKKMAEAAAHAAKAVMPGPHGPMGSGPHGPMMMEMHPMMHGAGNPGAHVVKAAVVTTGGGLMSRLSRHPLLMFGLGVVAGVVVYKYRKEIIATVAGVGEKGKDFVLGAKENLEDIIAETQEEGETKS